MDVTWLPDARPRERHLAVGEFDGVHIGHREVIRGADTVLTFEPHPRAVVAPDSAPKLLTPLAIKADLIAELGVRELVVIPFDGSFAAQTAQEFIDRELIERLGARTVSVGENFRFGNRAKGDTELLRAQDAFGTRVVRARRGRRRDRLLDAHPRARPGRRGRRRRPLPRRAVPDARHRRPRRQARPHARLPDRQPRARQRARRARPRHLRLPRRGRRRAAPSRRSTSACGPTFQTGRGLLVEAFLLDFDGDIYGQELRLDFLERLRGEKRFDSVDALVEQMHRDVDEARRIAA